MESYEVLSRARLPLVPVAFKLSLGCRSGEACHRMLPSLVPAETDMKEFPAMMQFHWAEDGKRW
eukprot:2290981-Amphidinium_carterae.1